MITFDDVICGFGKDTIDAFYIIGKVDSDGTVNLKKLYMKSTADPVVYIGKVKEGVIAGVW